MSGKNWLLFVRSESPVAGKMFAYTLKAQRNLPFPPLQPHRSAYNGAPSPAMEQMPEEGWELTSAHYPSRIPIMRSRAVEMEEGGHEVALKE